MKCLFEPLVIRDMVIRNRFMRSATTSAYADDEGVVRDVAIRLYESLARGDVGLIVKGHLYVMDSGKAHDGMAGISSEKHIPKLKELTSVVHKHDGRIVAQINHAGVVHRPDRAGPSIYSEDDWTSVLLRGKTSYRNQVNDFLDMVRTGQEPIPPEVILELIQAINAAERSLETHQLERLVPVEELLS